MLATPSESAVKLPPRAWLPLVVVAECVPEEPPIIYCDPESGECWQVGRCWTP